MTVAIGLICEGSRVFSGNNKSRGGEISRTSHNHILTRIEKILRNFIHEEKKGLIFFGPFFRYFIGNFYQTV